MPLHQPNWELYKVVGDWHIHINTAFELVELKHMELIADNLLLDSRNLKREPGFVQELAGYPIIKFTHVIIPYEPKMSFEEFMEL